MTALIVVLCGAAHRPQAVAAKPKLHGRNPKICGAACAPGSTLAVYLDYYMHPYADNPMHHHTHTTTLQDVARGLLGTFMVVAGTGHLTFARQEFQAQVPDFVPLNKDTVVLQSGVVEIGLGLALLLWKPRRVELGLGLAVFYALVFPGNIHQYTHHISAFGLDTDTKRLGRLFFQPVLMGWALWSTGALKALQQHKFASKNK